MFWPHFNTEVNNGVYKRYLLLWTGHRTGGLVNTLPGHHQHHLEHAALTYGRRGDPRPKIPDSQTDTSETGGGPGAEPGGREGCRDEGGREGGLRGCRGCRGDGSQCCRATYINRKGGEAGATAVPDAVYATASSTHPQSPLQHARAAEGSGHPAADDRGAAEGRAVGGDAQEEACRDHRLSGVINVKVSRGKRTARSPKSGSGAGPPTGVGTALFTDTLQGIVPPSLP